MKKIGLNIFGAGERIPQSIGHIKPAKPQLRNEVYTRIMESPLEHLLEEFFYDGRRSLWEAVGTSAGTDVSRGILSNERIWELSTTEFYSAILDLFKSMITNGAGDFLVEEAHKRKKQLGETFFYQIGRFAAYGSGGINEFISHPLIFEDEVWNEAVSKDIITYLGRIKNQLEENKSFVMEKLDSLQIGLEYGHMQKFVYGLNQDSLSLLRGCLKRDPGDYFSPEKIDIGALKMLILGKPFALNLSKDGSILQLVKHSDDGQVFLVNTVYTEYAHTWENLYRQRQDIIVPYLEDSPADMAKLSRYPVNSPGSGRRVVSEYAGLNTERGEYPLFLSNKLEALVNDVASSIRNLGYADHRYYRDNYCFYFVNRTTCLSTTDFKEVYSGIENYNLVVRRIDLDSMKKFR